MTRERETILLYQSVTGTKWCLASENVGGGDEKNLRKGKDFVTTSLKRRPKEIILFVV